VVDVKNWEFLQRKHRGKQEDYLDTVNNIIKGYELLIFDLDGTLVDSSDDICDSVNKTLLFCGLGKLTKNQVMSHVGFGSSELIKRCLQDRSALFEKAHDYYKRYCNNQLCNKTKLYEGVKSVLEELYNSGSCRMVVFSNRSGELARRILSIFGIMQYLEEVVGDEDGFRLKPDSEAVSYWMERFCISNERALMVGDSLVDMEVGVKSGIKTCFVKFGYGKYHNNLSSVKSDYAIGAFSEILEIVYKGES